MKDPGNSTEPTGASVPALDPLTFPHHWAPLRTPAVRAEMARLAAANPSFCVSARLDCAAGTITYYLHRSPDLSTVKRLD